MHRADTPPRGHCRLPAAPATGFTLLELLVAVAVMGIIAAVAIPTFIDSVRKSRRADAMAALTQLMQAQERWRANNALYYEGALSALPGAPSNGLSASGYYAISVVNGSATGQGYTAQAVAVARGSQANDSNCRTFSVTIAGGNPPSYQSQSSSGAANGSPDPCWVK